MPLLAGGAGFTAGGAGFTAGGAGFTAGGAGLAAGGGAGFGADFAAGWDGAAGAAGCDDDERLPCPGGLLEIWFPAGDTANQVAPNAVTP